MLRATYDKYLNSFNGANYDEVLKFWAPEFVVYVGEDVLFDSPQSLKKTYAFLHSHVTEEILVDRYLSDNDSVFMEARVRITAKKELSQKAIEAEGLKWLAPIPAGVAFEIPQFIHYSLEDGKFKKGICLVSGPVKPL